MSKWLNQPDKPGFWFFYGAISGQLKCYRVVESPFDGMVAFSPLDSDLQLGKHKTHQFAGKWQRITDPALPID